PRLAAMTGTSLTELIDPVNELVQADIFADDSGQLAFRHDIIREAVRGSLLPRAHGASARRGGAGPPARGPPSSHPPRGRARERFARKRAEGPRGRLREHE